MDGKILIVDDNEDVLFALNLLLEPYVEKIKVTTSPARIEYFMDNFNPDIILLDMNFSRDASSGQEGFLWLEKILQKEPASRRVVYHRIRRHRESRESYSCRRRSILFLNPGKPKNFWPPFPRLSVSAKPGPK